MIHRPLTWTWTRLLAGLLLMVPAASSLAADPPADAALKEKGLRKSGIDF